MAELGEARTRDEPDVTGPEDGNFHECFPPQARSWLAGENRAGLGRREGQYSRILARLRTTACEVFAAAQGAGVLAAGST